MKTNIYAAQRALLERLLELTDEQGRALDAGDLERVSEISKLRRTTVDGALAYLPPNLAWEPELADLVAIVQRKTDTLRQSTYACMAKVRRSLAQLTAAEQMKQYLGHAGTWQRGSWQG